MFQITGSQVRAARSLIGWSREQLAAASNVSRSTIRNFEAGSAIRSANIQDLHYAFDQAGVDFLEHEGVKKRPEGLKDFMGPDSCDRFFKDITSIVRQKNCEVIAVFQNQDILIKSTGSLERSNFQRMQELQKITTVKCLLQDNSIILPEPPSFEVRVLPEEPATAIGSSFAYDNELTLITEKDFYPLYVVFQVPHLARGAKENFYKRWDAATPYYTKTKARKKA